MSFWRDFSKAFFKVSVVISLIGTLIAAFLLTKWMGEDGIYAFFLFTVLLIVLAFAVIVFYSLWGMLIELCENNAKSAAKLEEIAYTLKYDICEQSNNTNPTIAKLSSISSNNSSPTNNKWTCSVCNTLNDITSMQCKDCGKYNCTKHKNLRTRSDAEEFLCYFS